MSDVSPQPSASQFSEAAIFGRVVETSGVISPHLAEHMLSLDMSNDDKERLRVLLEKNIGEGLSAKEQAELDNLNHVGDLISLWHSRARRVLNPS